MRVDIQPQWRKLADWYWDIFDGKEFQDRGMSIWQMLEQNYGARKGFSITNVLDQRNQRMWVHFPDEESYLMFVLKWS